MNNKLREDANRLEESVDELSSEIDILEPEADRAAKVEGQLRDIAGKQHANVDKLVELVKENENVLVEMRVSELLWFMTSIMYIIWYTQLILVQSYIVLATNPSW